MVLTLCMWIKKTEVNLRITQARKHTRDLPWLVKPRADVTRSQNRGINGPTKRTYALQIFFHGERYLD